MVSESIRLRTALPSDASSAAALMYETMGPLGDYIFGRPDAGATIRLLARIFGESGHLFSYTFSTMAEVDGNLVGLLQALSAAYLLKSSVRLLSAVRRGFGLRAALGMAWRGIPFALEPDAFPGEYYISVLAVAPDFRNRGIGRSLLQEAERQARETGHRFCSLGVLLENGGAKRLYERTGYRVERKTTTRFRAPGVQYNGFYRMIKPMEEFPSSSVDLPAGKAGSHPDVRPADHSQRP